MTDERTLRAILRFGIQKKDVAEAKKGVKEVEKSLKSTEEQMRKLRESGEQLTSVGLRLAAFGAAVSGPFVLAARSYVQYAGQADTYSRRWLAATGDLEQAQIRIGRVAARELVPALELAADLADKASRFVEHHPEIIRAALLIGGATAGASALLSVGGQLQSVIGTLGLLSGGAGGTATGVFSPKTMIVQSAGKLIIAGAVGEMLSQQLTGQGLTGLFTIQEGEIAGAQRAVGMAGSSTQQLQTELERVRADLEIVKQYRGGWAALIPGMTGPGGGTYGRQEEIMGGRWKAGSATAIEDKIAELERLEKEIEGALAGTSELADAMGRIGEEAPAASEMILPDAAVDAYIAYQQDVERMEQEHADKRKAIIEDYNTQVEQATQRYEERRAQMIEDYEERRAQDVADFERRRERIERDFQRARELAAADFAASQTSAAADFTQQEGDAEEGYYSSRAKRARDFGIEIERMEEDHQRQMSRMREDHEAREGDLIAARDALGLVREQRQYEKDRQRAEEDYQVQASRRSEDYAREMADMEEAFREQREARLADFERRQAEAQAAYEERRQQELEEYEQRQADEQEDFDLRQAQEAKHNAQMLLELHDQHTKELRQMYNHKNDMLSELDKLHRDELSRRETAFANQLNALDSHLLGEQVLAQGYYDNMKEDFRGWLQDMQDAMQSSTSGGVSSFQHGGYTHRGLAYLHDREFVLNPDTTQAVDSLLGGALTQQKILAAVSGGMSTASKTGVVIQVNQSNWGFKGAFSNGEKKWFKQMAYDQTLQAVSDVVDGLK
ncbi:MAG: hypothetical protein JXA14_24645 [Anaerolineae bacterium]|nr:hypothetical protein [Anaerolineae bacterium]